MAESQKLNIYDYLHEWCNLIIYYVGWKVYTTFLISEMSSNVLLSDGVKNLDVIEDEDWVEICVTISAIESPRVAKNLHDDV